MKRLTVLLTAVLVLLISQVASAEDVYIYTDRGNYLEYWLRTEAYQGNKYGESIMVLKVDTYNPKMPPFIWVYSFYQTNSGIFYEITQHSRDGKATRMGSGNIKDNYVARRVYQEMRKRFKSPY